ncbi:hypothetical protein MGYG_05770 [Nannizzia gypsea CBS 118893]|uniref:Uncharacterized protein n=1 Tax=Arthroderma gypseum (strain ATCC MYA-4604 / CBS 118893) TaxID=535722 RepID=E4UXT9_ARTGP|nr:hypothetical protein MGYG_05770 [Nannizzia gypsea CBS 118893]EFR02771.1 hypothetical protein MGYG_05770 [Nannizzia gypsea CBS 118893]
MTSLQHNSIMKQANAWRRAGEPLPACNEADVCDEETRRDVDLMILDYIVCATITSILHERIANRQGAEQQQGIHGCDRWLEIAEATLHLFKANNSEETLSDDIKFKIKTLNFSNLFFRRFKRTAYLPSRSVLAAQRKESCERAKRWLEENSFQDTTTTAEGLDQAFEDLQPISASQVDDNRRTFLDHMAVTETEEYEFNVEASVTLLDILPELMELCDSAPEVVSDDVCTIAVFFMLHAAIEQGLLYGRTGRAVIDEAFAWGNKDDDHSWVETRDKHRQSLCPTNDEDVEEDYGEQLKRIIYEHPPFEFEGEVLNLIKLLQQTWDTPILNQLEQGKLFSLDEDEVTAFKRRVIFTGLGSRVE